VFTKSYEHAYSINYSVNGKKLPKQLWNIKSKIKEVDLFLKKTTELIPRVRESHPEVCFQSLSDLRVVKFSNKKVEGLRERIALLVKLFQESQMIHEEILNRYKRNDL